MYSKCLVTASKKILPDNGHQNTGHSFSRQESSNRILQCSGDNEQQLCRYKLNAA